MKFENKRQSAEAHEAISTQIRRDIVSMLLEAGSGHSGGPLGTTDIYSVLYFGGFMKYDPSNPDWEERDRFVLSAGHMAPVLYAALANAGMFPREELMTLRKYGTRLQGHPGRDMGLPGIETSSGSLGQGISIAVGMAMSDRLLDKNKRRVYSLTGDGELQEGSVWEAAMSASNFGLDNFCWIIDNNDCQIDGRLRDVMNVYPIDEKCRSFGFDTIVVDGHDFNQLYAAFDRFTENWQKGTGVPTAIVAETKMGKGVSFMEDQYEWHGKPPNADEAKIALSELD